MFTINTLKCLRVFDQVYVSSDCPEILRKAKRLGAIPLLRDESLCGDTPNIPVYQDALKHMKNVRGIVAVQSCSPTIKEKILIWARELMLMGCKELMTCHPLEHKENYHDQSSKIYGSIWGISKERLENYLDPYRPSPEAFIVDESIDIHDLADYKKALCQ